MSKSKSRCRCIAAIGLVVLLGGSVFHARQSFVAAQGANPVRRAAAEVAGTLCAVNACPFGIVHIRIDYPNGQSFTGTGVLLPDGRVLTAAHVIRNGLLPGGGLNWDPAASLHVIFGGRNGQQETDGVTGHFNFTLWQANGADLAVIRGVAAPPWATGIPLANMGPKVGDVVTSVGLETPEAVRVHGSSVLSTQFNGPIFAIGVQIQPGDSGGPVFNQVGELVGINQGSGGFQQQKVVQNFGAGWLQQQVIIRNVPASFIQDLSKFNLR